MQINGLYLYVKKVNWLS